jgi:hypothetical protein
MTTLDDCRLKAVRAEKHLDEITAELSAWRQRNPQEVLFTPNPKDREEVAISMRVHEDPPAYIGAIFGDFLNNCRSILDYIATRLDLEAGGSGNNIYFPIQTSRKRFNNQAAGKFKHFDPGHLALIEGVQPFNGTRKPFTRHPGAILGKLHRLDKHHAITPTVVAPFEFKVFFTLDDRVVTKTVKAPLSGGRKIEDNTEIAKVRWPPWPRTIPRPHKMEMNATIAVQIEFGGFTLADAGVSLLTWARDDVLALFEPVLKKLG